MFYIVDEYENLWRQVLVAIYMNYEQI
jgi:hypothetical protein